MRYVRTKDGRIVKIGEQTDIGYEKGTFEVHNRTGIVAFYEPIEVLKTADTIEELCDEFVAVRKSDNTAHLGKIENTYWFYEQTGWVGRVENYKVIYGAIWTDKGLIYVAKMNNKGELELL